MSNLLDRLSWDDIRLIRTVAEAGSLPAAAGALGVNHSTVFRRLRQVEDLAGCPLFERDRTRLAPTPTGEELAALGRRMAGEVDAASLKLAGREPEPEGEIRVATADSLLIHLLTPLLPEFREACPRIRLDVVIGNPALNLSRRDADVAIRATDDPPDTLVGRKVARIGWALYGRRGVDPATMPVVALGESLGGMKVVKHALETAGREGIAYRVDSVLGLAAAVEAGLGIGHLPCFIAERLPGLARLAGPEPDFATDLWLLTHADLRRSARVRALLDFLADAIGKRRRLIEGG